VRLRDKVKWTWNSIGGLDWGNDADFLRLWTCRVFEMFANCYESQIEDDIYDKNSNLCGSTLLCQMTLKNLNSMTKENL